MPSPPHRTPPKFSRRPFYTGLVFTAIGAGLGMTLGVMGHLGPKARTTKLEVPAPHVLPKVAGGTSLRFAMVNDVLSERYFRHSPAYYQHRNQVCRQRLKQEEPAIAAGTPPSTEYFSLMDDLGAGLEFLGQHQEAIALMRRKLELLADVEKVWQAEQAGDEGLKENPGVELDDRGLSSERQALYATYANLGTFLMLESLGPAIGGDRAAQAQLKDSVQWVRKAIALNPGSHFGREIWQVVIGEYVLAACEQPAILATHDMVGNRLADFGPQPPYKTGWVRYQARTWAPDSNDLKQLCESDEPDLIAKRKGIREKWITRVGGEAGWKEAVPAAPHDPVPFDEPTLAILGMWMLGGGPNPHFAVALGGIMERVGEPKLAWLAYERAFSMSDHFWSNPKACQSFAEHCRKRQTRIESDLAEQDPTLPADGQRQQLKARYDGGLAKGLAYQQAIAAFEVERIRAGIAHDDPAFYQPFHAQHGSIASPVGTADRAYLERHLLPPAMNRILPAAFLYAGLGSVLGLVLAIIERRRGTNN